MSDVATAEAISPDQVKVAREDQIPIEVFNAINTLITKNINGDRAIVYQDDIVQRVCSMMEIERNQFDFGSWLDIEDIYRARGWKVEYDRPAYNESYRAHFIFTAIKRRRKY